MPVESSKNIVTIRRAALSDLAWVMLQAKRFSEFYKTTIPLFGGADSACQVLSNLIENHLVLIAASDVGPLGFISGIVGQHPYNPSIRLLTETFWWVDEDYRGSRAGLLLLNEFVRWGQENCDWITMCSIDGAPGLSDDAYIKRGFKLKERSYLMEVN